MDTAYARLGLPFDQAVFVLATVVSSSRDWSVANAGLKAFGMDHGKPELADATVLSCSDEHTTFAPALDRRAGAPCASPCRPDHCLSRARLCFLWRGGRGRVADRSARLVGGGGDETGRPRPVCSRLD